MKSLDEDLKRKIVSIITLRNKKEEERQELIYNSYSFHNETNMMDITFQNKMSLKEITDLLKDLAESNKQLTLWLKMIEIEINYIKENLPGRITNIIEKTDKIDKRISQKYIKELLNKKSASASTYKKGSMDEILIQKFLEKQKLKEKDLYNLDINLENNSEETNSETKESKE